MGAFADAVQARMRDRLAERLPSYDWETERSIEGTPVDVAGERGGHLVVIELEWRRADPADNTAKLFRHLAGGALDEHDRVDAVQVFTGYYDLTSGGVSSKRKNAEFVGDIADDAFGRLTYRAVDVDVDPPKRGGDWPDGWEAAVEAVTETITDGIG